MAIPIASEQLTYITTEEYTAENEDEITFPKNAVITVTQRSLDGWWQATYNEHTGLVPSSLLVPFGEQPDIIQVWRYWRVPYLHSDFLTQNILVNMCLTTILCPKVEFCLLQSHGDY